MSLIQSNSTKPSDFSWTWTANKWVITWVKQCPSQTPQNLQGGLWKNRGWEKNWTWYLKVQKMEIQMRSIVNPLPFPNLVTRLRSRKRWSKFQKLLVQLWSWSLESKKYSNPRIYSMESIDSMLKIQVFLQNVFTLWMITKSVFINK